MKVDVEEVFAYYLPQFHTIKENDEWWGKGFTEWVKLRNAKQLFSNHRIPQPIEPLSYYDLTNVTTIEAQYALAKEHGVSTFCFWHYWFDNEDMLLERPAELLLASDINVKFCFAWANHSWWNKTENKLLKQQKYDFSLELYFDYLLPFFKDHRYTKINNKPVYFIYDLKSAANGKDLIDYFERRAIEAGFDGVYFIADNLQPHDPETIMVDQYLNSCDFMRHRPVWRKVIDKFIIKLQRFGILIPRIYEYNKIMEKVNMDILPESKQIPIVFPGWDSSIRHGKKGVILKNSTPVYFDRHVSKIACLIRERTTPHKFVVVKSWNEWAEGNYIEPCDIHGDSYLKTLKKYFNVTSIK